MPHRGLGWQSVESIDAGRLRCFGLQNLDGGHLGLLRFEANMESVKTKSSSLAVRSDFSQWKGTLEPIASTEASR